MGACATKPKNKRYELGEAPAPAPHEQQLDLEIINNQIKLEKQENKVALHEDQHPSLASFLVQKESVSTVAVPAEEEPKAAETKAEVAKESAPTSAAEQVHKIDEKATPNDANI